MKRLLAILILISCSPLCAAHGYYQFPNGNNLTKDEFEFIYAKIEAIFNLESSGHIINNLFHLISNPKPRISDDDLKQLENLGIWQPTKTFFTKAVANVAPIAIKMVPQQGSVLYLLRNITDLKGFLVEPAS